MASRTHTTNFSYVVTRPLALIYLLDILLDIYNIFNIEYFTQRLIRYVYIRQISKSVFLGNEARHCFITHFRFIFTFRMTFIYSYPNRKLVKFMYTWQVFKPDFLAYVASNATLLFFVSILFLAIKSSLILLSSIMNRRPWCILDNVQRVLLGWREEYDVWQKENLVVR